MLAGLSVSSAMLLSLFACRSTASLLDLGGQTCSNYAKLMSDKLQPAHLDLMMAWSTLLTRLLLCKDPCSATVGRQEKVARDWPHTLATHRVVQQYPCR